eukprot:1125679-Prymnesium_polylepis.1
MYVFGRPSLWYPLPHQPSPVPASPNSTPLAPVIQPAYPPLHPRQALIGDGDSAALHRRVFVAGAAADRRG